MSGRPPQRVALVWIFEQPLQRAAKGLYVARRKQQPGPAMLENLSWSADIGRHDRQTMEHAFQDHHAEWLVTARDDENIGRSVSERHL
jgi:hypothetical protein